MQMLSRETLRERLRPKVAQLKEHEAQQRTRQLSAILEALETSQHNADLAEARKHIVHVPSMAEKQLDDVAKVIASEVAKLGFELNKQTKHAADNANAAHRLVRLSEWEQHHRRAMEKQAASPSSSTPYRPRSSSATPASEAPDTNPRPPRYSIPQFKFSPPGISPGSAAKGIATPSADTIRVGTMNFPKGMTQDAFYNRVLSSGYVSMKPSTISNWWTQYQTLS